MNIEIVNKRNYKGTDAYYVGRPTALGNPFSVKDYGHGTALGMYLPWLKKAWKEQPKVKATLLELARILKRDGHIKLMCWCAPKPCHAKVIGKALLGIINKGMV